jgi:lipoprotein-releasing system permease protein
MLPLQIALRFLKSSIGQTILIVLGISVGVSVQVFIGSLIGGLQQSLVDTTIGNSSQVTIQADDYISDYSTISDSISDIDEIRELSYSLDANGTVIVDDVTSPILLRGLDFERAEGIYELQEKLISGRYPESINEVMIGYDLYEELGLEIDDTITVSIPLIGDTNAIIVGIYDFNISSINSLWMLSTIPTAQAMLQTGDVVSSIEMQVDDVFAAKEVAIRIEETIGTDYTVSNWIDNNQELLTGLEAQSSSSLMIQVFVTISVVLGITSVLAITVIQKSRQIGILKAMGIKDRTASLIFLSEGFLLGILGAIFGVLLGLLLTYVFSTFALDADGNPVVPLLIDPQFIAISAVVALLSASVASIIPARRSSRLSVIEVIKNG